MCREESFSNICGFTKAWGRERKYSIVLFGNHWQEITGKYLLAYNIFYGNFIASIFWSQVRIDIISSHNMHISLVFLFMQSECISAVLRLNFIKHPPNIHPSILRNFLMILTRWESHRIFTSLLKRHFSISF